MKKKKSCRRDLKTQNQQNIPLNLVQFILVNVWIVAVKDLEQLNEVMAGIMKVIGVGIKPVGLVNSSILMGIFMKVNGVKIWQMERENMFKLMEHLMKDNGKMISKMVLELRFGLMEISIVEVI